MKIINLKLGQIPLNPRPFTLCLGFFDGVHQGHQALLEAGKKLRLPLAVLTFSDHTAALSKNGSRQTLITPFNIKQKLFKRYGVDYLYVIDFTAELKSLTPDEFITTVLNALGPHNVIVGADYRFGIQATGDGLYLANSPLANFKTTIVPPVYNQAHQVISSTLTRKLILAGDMLAVHAQLGRHYQLQGRVQPGFGRGKSLGFPTANIHLDGAYLLPKNGIYVAYMTVDEQDYLGIANIGIHPSLNRLDTPILEVHLFDFHQSIYGHQVSVYFLYRLRDEIYFPQLSDLTKQMQEDKIQTLTWAKDHPLNK
ncbi:MAG TPA: riboflavin biosynthesis protein RibF [Bacilli bacterium]|jgi:riboflavin kinase/FMN adenylyltransferase|nr:riboflavin biosynthesis protein RibF [Bacilli bacterium]MDD4344624.1 riboflavin biosynthesis protein RibF [Bacilli bacterium]MDD4520602.1 riboflavin biosynthesis protein RibF [Bacilli bacterium]MDY0399294.1 riboflavin biosynthesis protein RibF [Bacilli bacterium]HKM10843.1 riboflavin biosynthesis protein RibF [Bacilli bacterium]